MLPVRVLLFGAPRAERAGEPVALPRARGRALLAHLCAERRPHPRAALAALLWPDYAPADAYNNLRRELSLLRRALGSDLLDSDRGHAGINPNAPGGVWIDVAAFDAHVAAAEAHHGRDALCADCAARLAAAEALYTADFLAGFSLPDAPDFDEWRALAEQRFRATADAVRSRLAAHHLARGEFDRALDYALRRLAADPLNEPAHRDRLRALAGAGRPAAALRAHEQFAGLLAREVGQPPEPETLALLADIQRRPPTHFPPPDHRPTEGPPRSNLPGQTTPFLGREAELDDLTHLFDDPATRLITLLGPGGMGKTRLALAWAGRQLDAPRFRDGVCFVDLAPVPDAAGVFPALAAALRFPPQAPGQDPRPLPRQIADYLAARRLLLLLDNAEHLLEAGPQLVDLLAAAPGIGLLVTSRERLNVRPEQVYAIDGLALPPPDAADPGQFAAGRLFLQCARRLRPRFDVTAKDERRDLARICRLVGGMPLAIEMAAAWVDTLSPRQIADELEHGLSLLETDMADVPARQRSVRAAVDHAWQQLAEPERRVFARLSVFRGGMTREAAEAVAGATPRQLLLLVRKALLYADTGRGRYRLHELLRQYAAEKLADDEADARERHARFFARRLADDEPRLLDEGGAAVLARLDADSDNIDAAMRHLLARRAAAPLLEALNELCLYDDFRLRVRHGWEFCGRVVAAFDPPHDDDTRLLVARALNWRVYFHLDATDERSSVPGMLAVARALLDQVAATGAPLTSDYALNTFLAGDPGYEMDYTDAVVAAFESAYRLFEQAGNRWGVVTALRRLFIGYVFGSHADPAATRPLAERAVAHAVALTNRRLHSQLTADLLIYAIHFGERELIDPLVAEMERDLAPREPEPAVEAGYRGHYAQALLYLGRVAEAQEVTERLLDARRTYGLPPSMHDAHWQGRLLCHLGRYDEAAEQYRLAQSLARANGSVFVDWLVHVLDGMRLVALGDLDAAEQVLQAGMALDRSRLALADMAGHMANLGLVYARQGRLDEARPMLARSLRDTVSVHNYLPLIEVLQGVALTLATDRPPRLEPAAEVYGVLLGQPYYATARLFEDMTGRLLAQALQALPPDVRAVAEARGRAQPLWAAAAGVLGEVEGWRGDG